MTGSLNDLITLLNHYGEMFWNFGTVMFAQVCVLVTILLLADLFLRHKIRAVSRYWLWTLVLLKLVLPVTLYSPISAAYWLTDYVPTVFTVDVSVSEVSTVANEPSKPVAVMTKPISSDPFLVSERDHYLKPVSDGPSIAVPPDTVTPKMPSDTVPIPGNEVSAVDTQPTMAIPRQQLEPTAILLIIWLSMVGLLCGIVARRTWRVRQLTRQAVSAPVDLVNLMHDCCKQLGAKQNIVQLKISDHMGSPAICGLWKPTILLPRHLLDKLDLEQFRQILAHELTHWKRYDLHVNCLQTLLQILYFYNPMVWIANIILRRLREQAVDETVLVTFDVQSQKYSSTLLDIAELTRTPDTVSLQLIGIIEPRKPLVQRIRRIISGPIPRSAKLGMVGFLTIVLTGIVLLPMSGVDRSEVVAETELNETADNKTEVNEAEAKQSELKPNQSATIAVPEPDKKTDSSSEQKRSQKEASSPKAVLSGRIVDKSGAPVTDAKIELLPRRGGGLKRTETDDQGCYQFSKIQKPGQYWIRIKSQRWVGVEHLPECPQVTLSADTNTVQDVTLERACQLHIDMIDEEGKPASGVRVYVKSLANTRTFSRESSSTNRQGQVTIGLKPSQFKYLIGTSSPKYGFEKLVLKLDDPDKVTTRVIVQRKGINMMGKAVCSDGKPPAGWRINALPDWWNFGRYPSGQEIGKDGSFTLPHIVSEKYNVTISVPAGGQLSTPKIVLRSADLLTLDQPLSLKLDYPSPASLVSLSGRIRFVGGNQQHKGFHIFAQSDDPYRGGSVYIRPGQTKFRIDPIPRGKYTLRVNSTEFESKVIRNVIAPSKDIEIEIAVRGQLKIRGTVVRGDTKQPIGKFRVRAIKLRTLRGPNYVQKPNWLEVNNAQGKFELDVNGPGVYMVQVVADGFAPARSEQINTDQNQGKPVQVKLTKGVSLSGTVVDEKGQPITGAKVIPLSKARGTMPRVLGTFTSEEGAVETVKGKFTLNHLTPGKEMLKVTHPDYTFTIVDDINIDAKTNPELTITLKRGGTVQGRVTDANDQPEPNVTLFFQDKSGYGGGADNKAGRLATVVTDENGEYSVSHLPEQLCYVHRDNEWQANGVVRQAIVPENGKTSILNFGGQSKLTGRLKVNGVPLSNTRLLLSGENPHFGIFRAYAQTGSDGSFVFRGAGPAVRTLYYAVAGRPNDWVRVNSYQLTSQDQDLGTIDQAIGQLTVNCKPVTADAADNLRLTLRTYNPVWTFFGQSTGVLAPRQGNNDPFVFNQVPPGEYELIASRPGHPTVLKRIKITPANRNSTITLQLPKGLASLRGKLDETICSHGVCSSLKLWSQDKRLLTRIVPDDKGNFSASNIPAGNYYLTEQDVRNSFNLINVSLKEKEVKTLNLTSGNVKKAPAKPGFRVIIALTQNGIPLPGCDIQLQSTTGKISHHSAQNERQSFVGDPGTYNLTASYPGFQTLRRKVKLITSGTDGLYPKDVTMTLRLKPISE